MKLPQCSNNKPTPPSESMRVGWLMCAAMLIVLAALLTGCATTSPPPAPPCPTLPVAPPVSTPKPSMSYSENVRQQLEDWQKRLMATPLTR